MLELFEHDWRDAWRGAEVSTSVGAVYTRPEIVDLILDLADYRPGTARLADRPLLEPSCGDGAFLAAVLRRLLESERLHARRIDWRSGRLDGCVRAIDLSATAVESARTLIESTLVNEGCPPSRATELAGTWAIQGDFLLVRWTESFSVVVGNPPYVRVEDLPKAVLAEYRRRFETLRDRADLYIAFFEQALGLLKPDGVLAFISANRFAKNQYGAALRKLIAERFRVRHYVNLEHTQPFVSEVSAYPAIVVIDRMRGEATQAGTLGDIDVSTLDAVRSQALAFGAGAGPLTEFGRWYPDGAPWSSTSLHEVRLLSELSDGYPLLENSGRQTKVGIGVATGADQCFVLPGKSEQIELSRQIPLLMAGDVRVDQVAWSGHYLVNPFADEDDGSLAELSRYPGLANHLEAHVGQLRGRHVAKTRPSTWYRTIDRIWPSLTAVPKLVIPDIQRGGVVGFDDGDFYPHHNLYWISSDEWELRALQGLLRSTHVLMQVRAYSVQMRGGSLRYQAQTLRRIRVPSRASLAPAVVSQLTAVATSTSQREIDEAAAEAYGLPVPKTEAA